MMLNFKFDGGGSDAILCLNTWYNMGDATSFTSTPCKTGPSRTIEEKGSKIKHFLCPQKKKK